MYVLCNKHAVSQISKHFGDKMHHKRERLPNVRVKQVPQPLPPAILWVSICLLILPGKDTR